MLKNFSPDRPLRPWPLRIGGLILILALPLFLIVGLTIVVAMPLEAWRGLQGVFSGREVVQTAGSADNGVTLALLFAIAWGLFRLLGVNILGWVSFRILLYAALLIIPLVLAVGYAVETGLEQVLAARGYAYCTLHVTSRDRGESGFPVFVRTDRPAGCGRLKLMFPAHTVVDGGNEAFDLPPA